VELRELRPVVEVPGQHGGMPPEQILDVVPAQDIDGKEPVPSMQRRQIPRLLIERCAAPGRSREDEALEGRLKALGLLDLCPKLLDEILVFDRGCRTVVLALDAVEP
jgi:hypothetical protein